VQGLAGVVCECFSGGWDGVERGDVFAAATLDLVDESSAASRSRRSAKKIFSKPASRSSNDSGSSSISLRASVDSPAGVRS
jgi:hypothetical protein